MKNEIISLGVTDAALAILEEKYSVVPDATTKEGYQEIKDAKSELVPLRTGVEKERKLQVAEAMAHKKGIDTEAKRIIAKIEKIETPFYAAKKAVDDEEKRVEQEKLDAEKLRIENIEKEIQKVKECKNLKYGESTNGINEIISNLDKSFYLFDFEEFEKIARIELKITMETLESSLDSSIKAHEEKVNQEKIRIEQEERQAKMDAQQAEMDAKQKAIDDEENIRIKVIEDQIISQNAEKLRIELENELVKKAEIDAENRIKAERESEKQAEIARENDKEHKDSVKSVAINLLVDNGLSKIAAKKCIDAIDKGFIYNVKISY